MKMSRLERALRRARPYVHNPERFPDASHIGKRFRVERDAVAADMMDSSGEFRASGSPQSVVVFVEKTTPNLVSG
jgi:hypothetical protein